MNGLKVIISLFFVLGLFVRAFEEDIGITNKIGVHTSGENFDTDVYVYNEQGCLVKQTPSSSSENEEITAYTD